MKRVSALILSLTVMVAALCLPTGAIMPKNEIFSELPAPWQPVFDADRLCWYSVPDTDARLFLCTYNADGQFLKRQIAEMDPTTVKQSVHVGAAKMKGSTKAIFLNSRFCPIAAATEFPFVLHITE